MSASQDGLPKKGRLFDCMVYAKALLDELDEQRLKQLLNYYKSLVQKD